MQNLIKKLSFFNFLFGTLLVLTLYLSPSISFAAYGCTECYCTNDCTPTNPPTQGTCCAGSLCEPQQTATYGGACNPPGDSSDAAVAPSSSKTIKKKPTGNIIRGLVN